MDDYTNIPTDKELAEKKRRAEEILLERELKELEKDWFDQEDST